MPELNYKAGEDIKAGQHVMIAGETGLIVVCEAEQANQAMFVIDRDVKQGDAITYFLSEQPPRLVPSVLNEKNWAVLSDDTVTCDLTYQEARQLETALTAQKVKGVVVVTNAAGKRALERGHVRTADDN